jgi:hypothetical protein
VELVIVVVVIDENKRRITVTSKMMVELMVTMDMMVNGWIDVMIDHHLCSIYLIC